MNTSEIFLYFSANCNSLYLPVSPCYLDLLQHMGLLARIPHNKNILMLMLKHKAWK